MSSGVIIYSGLAGRYSSALFELAELGGVLDKVSDELDSIAKLLDYSQDLNGVMKSPVISKEDQKVVMTEILDRLNIGDLRVNFISIVLQNRRLAVLPSMIADFQLRLSERRGQILAEVTAPNTLSKNQMKDITQTIKKATGKQVSIREIVDKTILGGLIVKVGSRMFDNSLRTKLNKLHLAMKGIN